MVRQALDSTLFKSKPRIQITWCGYKTWTREQGNAKWENMSYYSIPFDGKTFFLVYGSWMTDRVTSFGSYRFPMFAAVCVLFYAIIVNNLPSPMTLVTSSLMIYINCIHSQSLTMQFLRSSFTSDMEDEQREIFRLVFRLLIDYFWHRSEQKKRYMRLKVQATCINRQWERNSEWNIRQIITHASLRRQRTS